MFRSSYIREDGEISFLGIYYIPWTVTDFLHTFVSLNFCCIAIYLKTWWLKMKNVFSSWLCKLGIWAGLIWTVLPMILAGFIHTSAVSFWELASCQLRLCGWMDHVFLIIQKASLGFLHLVVGFQKGKERVISKAQTRLKPLLARCLLMFNWPVYHMANFRLRSRELDSTFDGKSCEVTLKNGMHAGMGRIIEALLKQSISTLSLIFKIIMEVDMHIFIWEKQKMKFRKFEWLANITRYQSMD